MNLKFPLSVEQQIVVSDILLQESSLIKLGRTPTELVLTEDEGIILGVSAVSTFKGEYKIYPVSIAKVSSSHFKYIESEESDTEEAVPSWALGGCY